jgi:hypothetical protein
VAEERLTVIRLLTVVPAVVDLYSLLSELEQRIKALTVEQDLTLLRLTLLAVVVELVQSVKITKAADRQRGRARVVSVCRQTLTALIPITAVAVDQASTVVHRLRLDLRADLAVVVMVVMTQVATAQLELQTLAAVVAVVVIRTAQLSSAWAVMVDLES